MASIEPSGLLIVLLILFDIMHSRPSKVGKKYFLV